MLTVTLFALREIASKAVPRVRAVKEFALTLMSAFGVKNVAIAPPVTAPDDEN